MWLTRFAINRWVITMMAFIAILIFGFFSLMKLGRSSDPPGTTFPVVVVAASYPGASPQDMEKLVIKPVEDQLDGIDNLDHLSAVAQEGTAVVVVQFLLGTNLDLAAVDVQRRVDTARVFMPTDLDPPSVEKNGASQDLLDLAVSSTTLSVSQLADVVNNQVSPLIKAIPNVQTVDVSGAADREFHVEPDPTRLIGAGATLQDIFGAVASNNINVPGGILTQPTQETTVAIHAYIDHASDILGVPLPVPLRSTKNLRIGEVANAYDSHVEMRTISHYNGAPRVYISIGRNINSDEINSTVIARDRLKTIEAQFPQLQFVEIDAPADYTAKQLAGVWQSLFEGIALTAIVMMLFLHAWRNAVVVLVAIPSSIFATFIVMNLLQFHIDSLSMMGLSLIIGILVDDSIVVLENITRHRDLGEDPTSAAINGRSEIGSAAVAITMVDVVVFLPIAFLPGIVGKYLFEFGAVVVIATLFSLFVSFTLTPLLAARWSVKERSPAPPKWLAALNSPVVDASLLVAAAGLFALGTIEGWFLCNVLAVFIAALLVLNFFVHRYDRVLNAYRTRLLPFGLAHGRFVLFVCAVLFVNAIALVVGGTSGSVAGAVLSINVLTLVVLVVSYVLGWLARRALRRDTTAAHRSSRGVVALVLGFVRSLGTSRPVALVTLAMPVVLSAIMIALGPVNFDFLPPEQTGHITMTVTYPPGTPIALTNRYVTQLEEAILKISAIKDVSSTVGRKPSGFGASSGGNYAQLGADVKDDLRGQTNKTIDAIRNLAYLVPGGELQVAGDSGGGGNGAAIFYSLQGPDDLLGPTAEKVAKFIRSVPGTVNVQTSAEGGAPRLNVDIDAARANLLGISPADAATVTRIAVDGAVATKVRTTTGLVDVRVQFPAQDRTTVDQLQNVRVRANDGTLVPLGSIASFSWTQAPTKIERYNRERVINVQGDLLPGYPLGAVTAPLNRKLAEPGFLPSGVHLQAQGDSEFLAETLANMGLAIILSFGLVYMLMVILYGSFLEPLIVMFSVPLAIIGALTFLALMSRLPGGSGQSLNIISMLGIVMLFGLVAKNGILLVDYSNTLVKRGMRVREAVLQAAGTRFRPIVMTTAAMIFGMLPLALGYAEGGEWRQAIGTVIIGGLLSSLILTLFLVPMVYNTWMGFFERRADRKALAQELQPVATM